MGAERTISPEFISSQYFTTPFWLNYVSPTKLGFIIGIVNRIDRNLHLFQRENNLDLELEGHDCKDWAYVSYG
jgi:hypothetical protein